MTTSNTPRGMGSMDAASTDIGFAGPDDIAFTFQGSDKVSGSGFAELGEHGVREIEVSFRLGDGAVPKARRA